MIKRTALIFALLIIQFCAKAQNWQSVGTLKFNHAVDVLFSDTATGQLYSTGSFWMIDTASAYGLAQWNGNEWISAFDSILNSAPKRIVRFQGQIYVSKTPYLFKWNGSSWDTAAVAGGILGLFNDGDSVLYMMGNFGAVNTIPASFIARYDGTNWSALDATVWSGGAVDCAYRYQGELYFGGGFYNSGLNIWRIARWDGTSWNAVGGGITGSLGVAICMEEYNGELYVGGYMEVSQGNPGNFIARWDGTSWSQVGGGVWWGQVFNMEVFNNDLWVVGQFSQAGGIPATYIARYDGLDWCGVGVFDNAIGAIEVHNNELYVGGNFWTVDGDSVNKVVKWIGGNFADSCGHLNTGIESFTSNIEMSIFPNPTGSTATFQFTEEANRTIVITDQFGRKVWRRESEQLTVEFPAYEFEDGMYYYSILSNERLLAQGKLMVQH